MLDHVYRLRELRPCQKSAFDYAKRKQKIALFMQMRLGKTLVAIRWMKQCTGSRTKEGRKLIIAPGESLPPWKYELEQEGVSTNDIHYVDGPTKDRHTIISSKKKGWFLVNPETFIYNKKLCLLDYDCVVVDESTLLRNPKAKAAKIIIERFDHVEYKAILTGMPNPEHPMDYFNQFKFLYGQFLGYSNWYAFRSSFFRQYGYDWIPKPGTIAMIKDYVNIKAFSLSRKQAGIPDKKVYIKRYLKMNPLQFKAYKEVIGKFQFDNMETKWVPVQYTWLHRIAGGYSPDGAIQLSDAKAKEILSLLSGDLKGEQIVVWFKYNEELLNVADTLRKAGYTVQTLTGQDPKEKRGQIVFDFAKAKMYQVFCIQTKLGKFSLDLSNASAAIYYSNYYDHELRRQSEDRVVHYDKKDPLLIMDLVCVGSTDVEVLDALSQKKCTTDFFAKQLKHHVDNWKKKTFKNYKDKFE